MEQILCIPCARLNDPDKSGDAVATEVPWLFLWILGARGNEG